MGSGIELQGVDAMLEGIRRKLASGVARMENQGLSDAGEILAAAQREKVPLSTIEHVHMRDDIKVSPVRRGDGIRFVTIGPGNKTSWRAHFIEYGTKNIPATPFIYPSFHENKDRIAQLLANAQRKGMA
ncbi:HK97-gp10 family putative phage morphogenesis protein [Paenibacillus sp. SN-8-1]|uniref:HK97-gp10 family putative phage morphogenesis protein n=1 Tax=Paenibacillus sp. SN-8-1 TaxID=3435409 RepID=UPI003D9AB46B